MGKGPRRGRSKPISPSHAAEPKGPEGDAPLPVPVTGPAGPGAGGVDGSPARGLPGAAKRKSALIIAGADDVPVAARRCTEVLLELLEASCEMGAAAAETGSAVAVVGEFVASLMVEPSPVIRISSRGRSVDVTGKDGTVASTKSTTVCSTGSRTGRASVSGEPMVSTRPTAAASTTAATGTAATGTAAAGAVLAGAALFATGPATISCSAVDG